MESRDAIGDQQTENLVVWELASGHDNSLESVYAASHEALGVLQSWLAGDGAAVLVVLTRGAVALAGEDVSDLAGAAVWGLVRSAQAEHPDRIVLVDSDESLDLGAVIACAEPQLVVREGVVYGARLAPPSPQPVLRLPAEGWRLAAGSQGTFEDIVVAQCPRVELADGQVRVAVAAVGVNFRDVLVALGMYPGGGELGVDGAGVVVEVGPGVSGVAVGDTVMGLLGVVGSEAVVDARLVTAVPAGWSLAAAAGAPAVFLTALYGLSVLARAAGRRAGACARRNRWRGHGFRAVGAASGGPRFSPPRAAVSGIRCARWVLTTTISATRGPWSSRTKFLATTGGAGVDVVLNSLAGEFTDASLRLLVRGGRFIEMGKTDPARPGGHRRTVPGSAVSGV